MLIQNFGGKRAKIILVFLDKVSLSCHHLSQRCRMAVLFVFSK